MKFTLIFDPNKICTLKDSLGDLEECETGIFTVKPELSSNLSGVIEGCKVHLPKAAGQSELFILEQKQYGKPPVKRDAAGKPIMKEHKNSSGKTVVYPEKKMDGKPHPEAGKPVMVPEYEKKPLHSTITVDAGELSAYLTTLEGVL